MPASTDPILLADLLGDVRIYLDITWDDLAGDTKLSGIIARGMAYLNKTAGNALDYSVEDTPRQLLFDYVRYVRSNAFEDFEINFTGELLSLQNREEVARYIAAEQASTGV
jgi:hypothetical protein